MGKNVASYPIFLREHVVHVQTTATVYRKRTSEALRILSTADNHVSMVQFVIRMGTGTTFTPEKCWRNCIENICFFFYIRKGELTNERPYQYSTPEALIPPSTHHWKLEPLHLSLCVKERCALPDLSWRTRRTRANKGDSVSKTNRSRFYKI